ncbi:MAG TPA: MotA/TolQ/ExbB proton channel family protein [Leptospiraceae bacterium]|nr:MotA/TolQ/ExbB proton channel family protein [Leptospiraceae bacterium]HMW03797.1 MotA/TolQ/ExbB proton channel family protein [Leptospiraceae bacterium]HMX34806.1 MotA/TolQ/ExbB proton channel family protein [Leptospiraceae bacterium]HMY29777.1 MotA/TolQ/ExbB proton channel family protein [Leptospiraceae bacterium]HMZ62824.1 MotA/TolQ/ExbB proton channel family protein [Leptospiraceae bacterium]
MEQLVDLGEQLVFILMGLASILALAVGFERSVVFSKFTKKGDLSMRGIIDLLRKKDIKGVADLSTQSSNVYSRFAEFSVTHYNDGQEALGEMMHGKVISERIMLEKRLPILSTLGNNAPFLGLLGTVLGVIKAFNGLGTLGNSGAEVVMKSISTALLATAAGLFVAIPVVMANNYFSKKLKVITQNLEILSKEFIASYSRK